MENFGNRQYRGVGTTASMTLPLVGVMKCPMLSY